MIDKLENIGFYTLCDERAKNSSSISPMWRCEMVLTDRCNFKCPYCRGVRDNCKGDMKSGAALEILSIWAKDGLKHVRFSGGEPTVYPHLFTLVESAKTLGIERIAISTNGSADFEVYKRLIRAGVNDFSISLDACCSSYADVMAGVEGAFDKVVSNIKKLSELTYVTVGVVFTDHNVKDVLNTIDFAHDLGVADIRIISAAQSDSLYFKFSSALHRINREVLDKHPILSYRVTNVNSQVPVRGLKETDAHRCGLLHDDSMVAGDYHFPCIIYFREGGEPIGRLSKNMRAERVEWANSHDTFNDPICRKNCLDVCVDYNNKFKEMRNED